MAAPATDLPCDGDGVCMVCKAKPSEAESLLCKLCATPWHVPCLSNPPETMSSAASWECPDCAPPPGDGGDAAQPSAAPAKHGPSGESADLIASIRAIEADGSLTEQEKAKKRQELLGGGAKGGDDEGEEGEEDRARKGGKKKKATENSVLDLLDEKFNCSFCMQLPERPVTTPCGHNFCLKCFQKWVGQGKNTCAKCRAPIPPKTASNPRINSALVMAIRMAKAAKLATSGQKSAQVQHFIRNDDRPDKAFTTERAKYAGKANACSGQIFVTIPPDHFGPISAEYDPKRNQGVLVGETWEDRMECRQWGAHFPHVAGIAGQSDYGAQSVALSGGYVDDEDHGEWFLYTGSGGRDLSGNKRTNKDQSFDQKFEKLNQALRVSCRKGYPVRVVRSHKEKRSSYAPEAGVRYDGVYRIEKCWRKIGHQGFKVCRYLFVRCDNEPAPWTSDEVGDRPRPLPVIKELKQATDVTERKESPAWDYDEKTGWKWMKPPPPSKKSLATQDPGDRKRAGKVKLARDTSVKGRLLQEFSCLICCKVMNMPITTPCAHNFCKACLLGSYESLSFVKERTREGGRTLRAQKIVNKCPCCPTEISEFLQNPQVNREMMDLIESLKQHSDEEDNEEAGDEASDIVDKTTEHENDHPDVSRMSQREIAIGKLTAGEPDGTEGNSPKKANCDESDGNNLKTVADELVMESGQSKEEVNGVKGVSAVVSNHFPPSRQKKTASRKRPIKKLKGTGDDSITEDAVESDCLEDKVEAADGDSEVNAANSEQGEGCEKEAKSPNAKKSPVASQKRKKPMDSSASSGRMTRSMKAKVGPGGH